ncbi:uncharacterized protein LOC106883038 [Octopus bimaculoides]|uniref:uncharacterized protein LOC106883038 n=1 Tax=Octopus bimaculoides TaxID=37653 RepID=UPI00071C3D9B|nr:uncharacterized protein LOC106883038 [Octopus bimaculoides]|eukprot:XP_014789386.1 PREDICTED: uncharacterized protein LOC106883038 [Octopus bimaculoides]
MKIYQFKLETLLICTGLLLSALPQVWSMTVKTEVSTSNQGLAQYPKEISIFNRSHTLLQQSYIQSTDFSLKSNLVTTIRWEFVDDYGVWGVMFDSFSIPYTDHCTSDYFSIWDASGRCDNLKTVFCGNRIPETFMSCSSKIFVEYHSNSPSEITNFKFRVEPGHNKDAVLKRFEKGFVMSRNSEKERVAMSSEEEKVVIISLSVILPLALAVLVILAFILARHTRQDKTSSQETILPTQCPSSKKYVHTGNEKDSTVVKLFVDTDKKLVKTNKVRLQDPKNERVPLNSYADMPLNICSTVALNDVPEEDVDFEERPNGYLGLM